ncbi:MAG TPA: diacylglycerol kinase family protein [Chryseosolibacter sp.]
MNNEVSKVLFIINKHAGKGYQAALEGAIIDCCGKNNIECTIEYTKARGHATELASESALFDQVIAVGGDGTVNEVAQGLLNSSTPMGILPNGSGNGLARHLKIPINIAKALDYLMQSKPIAMDTFTLNGKLSLNVSGIGFDGHIANAFAKEKKRGLQGYAKHTLNEFFAFKEFEAKMVTAKESLTKKAFVIAIANSSQYGNNARIAPAASVCDELLHISILKKIPPYRIDFIYSFFNGTIDTTSFCEVLESKDVTITLDHDMAYHVDGEPCGTAREFTIRLKPASLKILVHPSTTRP